MAVLRVLSGKSSKFYSSTHFEQPMECIENRAVHPSYYSVFEDESIGMPV